MSGLLPNFWKNLKTLFFFLKNFKISTFWPRGMIPIFFNFSDISYLITALAIPAIKNVRSFTQLFKKLKNFIFFLKNFKISIFWPRVMISILINFSYIYYVITALAIQAIKNVRSLTQILKKLKNFIFFFLNF